jgi:hypothetical protein
MADAAATRVLFESASELVILLTNVSDGTGESAVLKVDVSALTPACAFVNIRKIHWVTRGMGANLLWDATADVLAFPVPDSAGLYGCIDFSQIPPGALKNNAGAGVTGDIQLTTVGHTSADTYYIILELQKVSAL